MKEILKAVEIETIRAQKHGEKFVNAHEAYGVILEEVEEFWDIVKLKKKNRDPQKMYEELIQIAAMAVKGAQSIDNFWGGNI